MANKNRTYVVTYRGITVKVLAGSSKEAHHVMQYTVKTNPKILSTWAISYNGKTHFIQADTKKAAIAGVLLKYGQ